MVLSGSICPNPHRFRVVIIKRKGFNMLQGPNHLEDLKCAKVKTEMHKASSKLRGRDL